MRHDSMRDTVVRGARWRGSVVQGLPYHVQHVHGLLGHSLTVLDVAQHACER